jgi:hypothetical protein
MKTRNIATLFVCLLGGSLSALAQTPRETELLNRVRELEERLAAVEKRLGPAPAAAAPAVPAAAQAALPSSQPAVAAAGLSPTGDSPSLPGFASGTTLNFMLDGYYEYNFNRPVGHMNLLRPYDQTSNSFTVAQGLVAVERAPDLERGRRFGLRLDLMFGQATEALAGNPAGEPRTAPYRYIYQAYGTYVFPVAKGLSVDFGRFSSPIGFEGSFAKDQINYTRSMLFNTLPFYHTGVRSALKIDDSTTATWMLVNGINQSEDFNGFKSNAFLLSRAFTKNLSWTGAYYFGKEGRDLAPDGSAVPAPDGRTHIADTYLNWNATSKLTLVGEGTYIVSRAQADSSPVHVAGGAGYLKYQFHPSFYLASRFEYISDRGGFASGTTQALKDTTLTASFQPADGLQIRWEYRRDYSNQPYFLGRTSGILRKEQNTALVGLLWWFGGKQGSW